VGIFDAVEQNQHAGGGEDRFEVGILGGGAEGNDSLMGFDTGDAVECGTVFEANGDVGGTGEVDDVLHAGAAGAAGYEDALKGVFGAESFGDGMNANEESQELIIACGKIENVVAV
jgi:hypothetical protein